MWSLVIVRDRTICNDLPVQLQDRTVVEWDRKIADAMIHSPTAPRLPTNGGGTPIPWGDVVLLTLCTRR